MWNDRCERVKEIIAGLWKSGIAEMRKKMQNGAIKNYWKNCAEGGNEAMRSAAIAIAALLLATGTVHAETCAHPGWIDEYCLDRYWKPVEAGKPSWMYWPRGPARTV